MRKGTAVRTVSRRQAVMALALLLGVVVALPTAVVLRRDWLEKRVKVIVPGRLVRGAWQRPGPLRRVIEREGIRTIVTLTAINTGDPKFQGQVQIVREMGIRWFIIPMRGSRGTPEQLALAADLLSDPANQPVFFHCVAGHHRTSLAHAAYLIRHEGRSAEAAWQVVSSLPWARPESEVDLNDRFLIEEFARIQATLSPSREHGVWEIGHENNAQADRPLDPQDDRGVAGDDRDLGRLESGNVQLRDQPAQSPLPIGTDDLDRARSDPS